MFQTSKTQQPRLTPTPKALQKALVQSAARADDFDPASSDADFLVEFAPEAVPGLNSFFGAKADLEQLLGRGVDLVEQGAVRNPYLLASINRNCEAVYAA